jgi:hypothetical protein
MTAGPPSEWIRIEGEEDVPAWRHHTEPVRVTTWDLDLLRYLDAALVRFNEMGPREFILPSSRPVPGEGCAWTDFRNST